MTRKLIWLSIASACFIPVSALPLGLGPIQVNSSLNQALDAQIELLSPEPGEIKDLSIKLAPSQAFEQAGIERLTLLSDLGFSVQTRPDGRNIIKVTSQRAIREPSLNFLIELSGTAGRVVKEFTVLLDPPDFRESAPLSSSSRVVRVDSPKANNERKPIPSRPGLMTAYDGNTYGPVAPGETLWRIANRIRPDSVSVERMMQALLEANPHAFLQPNIDSLMAGVNLRVPTAGEITSGIDILQKAPSQQVTGTAGQSDGPAVVSAQVQLLEPKISEEAQGQTASGVIPTEISPQAAAGSVPAISERFRIRLEGNGVKLRLAGIEDLQTRIGTLMEVDHAALVAVQPTAEETPAQASMLVSQADLVETAIGPEAVGVSAVATEGAHRVDSDRVSESEGEPVVSTQPTPITEQSVPTVEVVEPISSITVEKSVPVEESMLADMWSAIADGPKSMALAGFGSVLLIGLGGFLIRRLRRFESAEDIDQADLSFPAVSDETAVVAPVIAAGEVVPVSRTQRAESRSTQSGPVVNPLERADLLIAVGNLRDAETTVRLVLAEDPDNTTLAAKLLDIQFAMGNAGGFREEAERLRDLIKDTADPLWQHVIEMGRSLCPGDALFGGGTESPWSGSKTEKAALTAATSTVDSEDLDLDVESLYDHVADNEPEALSSVADDQDEIALTMIEEEEPATLKFKLANASAEANNEAHSDSFDLDWQIPSPSEDALITESEQTLILENLDGRLQDLDFDLKEDIVGQKQHAAVIPDEEQDDLEADLHSMEFDLEAVVQEDQANQAMEGLKFTDSGAKDGLVDEDYVETKLDLALAYVDMEDPVGARTLLEEVLQEGSVSQKQRADELMQRLSAKEESSRHQILNVKTG